MGSAYKRLGNYIKLVDERNTDLSIDLLLGLSISKEFIPSVANIIDADMANYKIIRKNQFACSIMQVRRDKKMPIALLKDFDIAIISQAYPVFEIVNESELLPEYLMMWVSRTEFDRLACFLAVGGVRGSLEWEDFCDMQVPVPDIDVQREIVKEYNTIINRIKLNEQLNQKLEETVRTIFNDWFLTNSELDSNPAILSEYIEFNPRYSVNSNHVIKYVEMSDLRQDSLSIKNYINREFTGGSRFKNNDTLLARITPCLENGKTAFVNFMDDKEMGFGSTEFIVMKAKGNISPYWVYCLARSENFRLYAISSMVGSSGRQRVHSDYLKVYTLSKIDFDLMNRFNLTVAPIFENIKYKAEENKCLLQLKNILFAKMSKPEPLETTQPT